MCIRDRYYVEIVEVNTTTGFEYTTQDAYLFINDLQSDIVYTCRIAAFTVGRGPLSEKITISILSSDSDNGKHFGMFYTYIHVDVCHVPLTAWTIYYFAHACMCSV